ncbi:MAG: DUF4124 domain-containing protein, partial [Myxococcaceae bacterium]|nr:DUF4124 domain-containing protein [Myxococcaceae bacterium]
IRVEVPVPVAAPPPPPPPPPAPVAVAPLPPPPPEPVKPELPRTPGNDIYRWVDADGVQHFSTKVPPEQKGKATKVGARSDQGAVPVVDPRR